MKKRGVCAKSNIKTAVSKPQHLVKWKRPQFGSVKLKFDGSKMGNSSAPGFVLRDWTGNTSILIAEAMGLKRDIREALKLGICNIRVEGDSNVIIQALNDKSGMPWQIEFMI